MVDGSLNTIFRKCERRESGTVDILLHSLSADGAIWSYPKRIIEASKNSLISPAYDEVRKVLYCVEYDGINHAELIEYDMNIDARPQNRRCCDVRYVEPGYYIWHIDIMNFDGNTHGIFLLRKKGFGDKNNKLAYFILSEGVWRFQHDIIPSRMMSDITYIYKSAFIPETDSLLCSARDKKGKYILFVCESWI